MSTRALTCSTHREDTEARRKVIAIHKPYNSEGNSSRKLVMIDLVIAKHKRLTMLPRLDLACGNLQ